MPDAGVNTFDEYIVNAALMVNICDLAGYGDEIIDVLLQLHTGRLHITQDCRVIFGIDLACCELLEKIIYYFRVEP